MTSIEHLFDVGTDGEEEEGTSVELFCNANRSGTTYSVSFSVMLTDLERHIQLAFL